MPTMPNGAQLPPQALQMQPTLKPQAPNPAAQIATQPAGGPGQGGAATAAGVQQVAQQQGLQAGAAMTPSPTHGQAAPTPAAGPSSAASTPHSAAAGTATPPQPGFVPNAQGQVVYPPGQGPVTGKIPQIAPQPQQPIAAEARGPQNVPLDDPALNPFNQRMAALQDQGYGFCPSCGSPGVSRERSVDGNTKCASGHVYPSRQSKAAAIVTFDELDALSKRARAKVDWDERLRKLQERRPDLDDPDYDPSRDWVGKHAMAAAGLQAADAGHTTAKLAARLHKAASHALTKPVVEASSDDQLLRIAKRAAALHIAGLTSPGSPGSPGGPKIGSDPGVRVCETPLDGLGTKLAAQLHSGGPKPPSGGPLPGVSNALPVVGLRSTAPARVSAKRAAALDHGGLPIPAVGVNATDDAVIDNSDENEGDEMMQEAATLGKLAALLGGGAQGTSPSTPMADWGANGRKAWDQVSAAIAPRQPRHPYAENAKSAAAPGMIESPPVPTAPALAPAFTMPAAGPSAAASATGARPSASSVVARPNAPATPTVNPTALASKVPSRGLTAAAGQSKPLVPAGTGGSKMPAVPGGVKKADQTKAALGGLLGGFAGGLGASLGARLGGATGGAGPKPPTPAGPVKPPTPQAAMAKPPVAKPAAPVAPPRPPVQHTVEDPAMARARRMAPQPLGGAPHPAMGEFMRSMGVAAPQPQPMKAEPYIHPQSYEFMRSIGVPVPEQSQPSMQLLKASEQEKAAWLGAIARGAGKMLGGAGRAFGRLEAAAVPKLLQKAAPVAAHPPVPAAGLGAAASSAATELGQAAAKTLPVSGATTQVMAPAVRAEAMQGARMNALQLEGRRAAAAGQPWNLQGAPTAGQAAAARARTGLPPGGPATTPGAGVRPPLPAGRPGMPAAPGGPSAVPAAGPSAAASYGSLGQRAAQMGKNTLKQLPGAAMMGAGMTAGMKGVEAGIDALDPRSPANAGKPGGGGGFMDSIKDTVGGWLGVDPELMNHWDALSPEQQQQIGQVLKNPEQRGLVLDAAGYFAETDPAKKRQAAQGLIEGLRETGKLDGLVEAAQSDPSMGMSLSNVLNFAGGPEGWWQAFQNLPVPVQLLIGGGLISMVGGLFSGNGLMTAGGLGALAAGGLGAYYGDELSSMFGGGQPSASEGVTQRTTPFGYQSQRPMPTLGGPSSYEGINPALMGSGF
jgi:hypothetical protein